MTVDIVEYIWKTLNDFLCPYRATKQNLIYAYTALLARKILKVKNYRLLNVKFLTKINLPLSWTAGANVPKFRIFDQIQNCFYACLLRPGWVVHENQSQKNLAGLSL